MDGHRYEKSKRISSRLAHTLAYIINSIAKNANFCFFFRTFVKCANCLTPKSFIVSYFRCYWCTFFARTIFLESFVGHLLLLLFNVGYYHFTIIVFCCLALNVAVSFPYIFGLATVSNGCSTFFSVFSLFSLFFLRSETPKMHTKHTQIYTTNKLYDSILFFLSFYFFQIEILAFLDSLCEWMNRLANTQRDRRAHTTTQLRLMCS